mmetsp:Transcript_100121/g.137885  ORF Transcript_100121/g.137885 Transcript_100121/m.137885 type:complete len:244 (-) Transcript_100121:38-769(-)
MRTRRVRLQQCSVARAAAPAAPTIRAPPLLRDALEVARIAISWDAAVRRPPAPLQSAGGALQVLRDAEVHRVLTGPRRQVPTLRVVLVKWLTAPTRIVGLAVAVDLLRPHALKDPLAEASVRALGVRGERPQVLVADVQLHVAHVVRGHLHLELHHLARSVGPLRPRVLATKVVAGRRPLAPVSANAAAVAALRAVAIAATTLGVPGRRLCEPGMARSRGRQGQEQHSHKRGLGQHGRREGSR